MKTKFKKIIAKLLTLSLLVSFVIPIQANAVGFNNETFNRETIQKNVSMAGLDLEYRDLNSFDASISSEGIPIFTSYNNEMIVKTYIKYYGTRDFKAPLGSSTYYTGYSG